MNRKRWSVGLFLSVMWSINLFSQNYRVEEIPFGNMDSWVTREIKESGFIGGKTKYVYAIGPNAKLKGNNPYVAHESTPWATSNVMAKVAGITKASISVFPEKRDNGYAARLDTRMENVKVLGIVNINVLATGTVFLGSVSEPISGMKDAEKNLNFGIPFHKKPVAVRFDYKTKMSGEKNRIKAPGFGKAQTIPGEDYPELTLFLQKRWETPDGRILAKRLATIVQKIEPSSSWRNGQTYYIMYGDITKDKEYLPSKMKLQAQDRYAVNSKGKSVLIEEVGWGSDREVPTHLQLQFSSSHGGAFIGSPGTTLWIDNVKLLYPESEK